MGCPYCGGDAVSGHQDICPIETERMKEEMREENKRYSWEPQIDCYLVEQGEELSECQGKDCNCCGRYNPVENSHTVDVDKNRVKRARVKYHQDRFDSLRKSLEHVIEKQNSLSRSRGTLETKMANHLSKSMGLLFS